MFKLMTKDERAECLSEIKEAFAKIMMQLDEEIKNEKADQQDLVKLDQRVVRLETRAVV